MAVVYSVCMGGRLGAVPQGLRFGAMAYPGVTWKLGSRDFGLEILYPRESKMVLGNIVCHLSISLSRFSLIYLHLQFCWAVTILVRISLILLFLFCKKGYQ